MLDIPNYSTGQGAAGIRDVFAAGDLLRRLARETVG